MSDEYTSRSRAVLGYSALKKLNQAHGIVFGVGGVGGWCAEALIRTGVGGLVLVDDDSVAPSNINRQRQAFPSTIGRPKVEVLKEILLEISPKTDITACCMRYTPENNEDFLPLIKQADFVIDAIDSVDCKADLMTRCAQPGMPPIFCSMGAALRTDPTCIRSSPFTEVSGDGLAKALRNRFRRSGTPFPHHICVHSLESPADCTDRGSLMSVTCAFGMALAALAVKSVTGE